MFLRERLKALREGWAELQQMWENRQQLLTQSLELQLLQRDASQAEVLLSHQEHRYVYILFMYPASSHFMLYFNSGSATSNSN